MRYLLLTLASLTALTPVFGKEAELSAASKEALGKLVAETMRPSLVFSHKIDALKFNRGEVEQAVAVKLFRDHAGSFELAAAHGLVIRDETRDPVVATLALRFAMARKDEAALCANLQAPDAAADFTRFLLQSMAFSALAKDRKEADELVLGSAIGNSLQHLGSQAKVTGDAARLKDCENQVLQAIDEFSKRYPELDEDAGFAKPIKQLLTEQAQRGQKAAKSLAADTKVFYQSLIGQRSERLNWNFEALDKLISLKVLEQKAIGTCVCSHVELVVQGGTSGKVRTLDIKVVHLVNKAGYPSVIDVY